jgi:hypothetical protein
MVRALAVLEAGVRGAGAGVVGALALITVSKGATFYTDMTISNTTGSAQTRDLLAAFGRYDPSTGKFSVAWAELRTGVSIPTGESTQTVTCVGRVVGTDWDCLAAVGKYDSAANTFSVEDAVVVTKAVTVTGLAITKVSFRTA